MLILKLLTPSRSLIRALHGWSPRSLAAGFLVALLALGLYATSLSADEFGRPRFEVSPVAAQVGAQMGYGQCPCFRWSLRLQLASGEWETRNFLITTDALLKLQQSHSMFFEQVTSRLYTVGAAEMLWKGGHIGIGFEGVTFGKDADLAYSDILRTGLYAMLNAVRMDGMRLDVRSGFQIEQLEVNLGRDLSRRLLPQSLVVSWNGGRWRGNLVGTMSMDPERGLKPEQWKLEARLGVNARLFTLASIATSVGLDLKAEHDPMRAEMGLGPDQLTGRVYMDLAWVPKPKGTPRRWERP